MTECVSCPADKGGDPELVRESQRRRYADVSLVDQVIQLDADWRGVKYELDQLLKESNAISKEVGQIKKVRSRVVSPHACEAASQRPQEGVVCGMQGHWF